MCSILRLLKLFAPELPFILAGVFVALLSLGLSVSVFAAIGLQAAALGSAATLRWLAAGRVGARYTERLTTHDATFRAIARLRLWLLRRLIPLAPVQLGMQRSGELLSRLTADLDALDSLLLRLVLPLILFALAASAGLYWLSGWNMTAAMAIAGLLLVNLAALYLIAHHAAPAQAALLDERTALRTHVIDGTEGLADLMASGAGHQQAAVITRSATALVHEQLKAARAQASANGIAKSLHGFILLALLTFSWPLVANGSVPPLLVLLAVLGYLGISELVAALPAAFMSAPRLAAAGSRIFALADIAPLTADSTKAQPLPTARTISFNNISLSYSAGELALNEVSFSVKEGERVAIMGTSGAGKSSLAALLLKFIAPGSGNIKIDTTNLAELNGDQWRSQISYLCQHTRLLAGTLRENLLMAKPYATDAEMQAALVAVELDGWLQTLPQGLDTWLGEDGLQLSGGQARRVALAMVVLKNAPLWLLDEPTEGLDARTAEAVLATLNRLTQNRTLLLITHDQMLLQPLALSRLILLENGQISSDGPI